LFQNLSFVTFLRYALPFLKETHGRLVVVSSLSGEIGLPYRSAHCASKFAVTGLFESLRMEISDKEMTITIVCPPSVRHTCPVLDSIS
jgi:short-subunit dehydrogenase